MLKGFFNQTSSSLYFGCRLPPPRHVQNGMYILVSRGFYYCPVPGSGLWTISWDNSRGLRLARRSRTCCTGCRRTRSTPWSKLLTQLLSMLETWVWCRTSGFRASGSFGTISWGPRLTCRLWTHCMSSRRSLNSLRSNSASGYTETLFPVESHVFG